MEAYPISKMKTISTKKTYWKYLWDYPHFAVDGVIVYEAPPFAPLDKFMSPFTKSMQLQEDELQVHYVKWCCKRNMSIPLQELVIKLYCYQDDFRFPEYYVLKLIVNGKVRHELDHRDGYTKETLLTFMEDFATAKNACLQ
ncbi:hypothetical protein CLV59_107312 [Chitinophaga dinghuensis]|uniref:Uncharacterized protein n=2 Tax=Chitinophaga dinghuensis TaxID=1539050 RepID=A0A327VQH2_9BACT|nr:hypothetical protein CLV59_107312 [Chitinophaga dinghuensis]